MPQRSSHLDDLGFAVADDELVTPVALARQVCRDRGHRRVALFVADETDFEGLEVVRGETGADAVIVGDLGDRWDYDELNRAFRLVMNGAELIAFRELLLATRRWAGPGRRAVRCGARVRDGPPCDGRRQAVARLLR